MVNVRKIAGTVNPADAGTKLLGIRKHIDYASYTLNMKYSMFTFANKKAVDKRRRVEK